MGSSNSALAEKDFCKFLCIGDKFADYCENCDNMHYKYK